MKESEFRIDLDELRKLADKQEWMVEKEFLLAVAGELGELRTKIERMEQQEPVAVVRVHRTGGNAGIAWSAVAPNAFDSLPLLRDGDKLYALPIVRAAAEIGRNAK